MSVIVQVSDIWQLRPRDLLCEVPTVHYLYHIWTLCQDSEVRSSRHRNLISPLVIKNNVNTVRLDQLIIGFFVLFVLFCAVLKILTEKQ